jgi:hypothetical protein
MSQFRPVIGALDTSNFREVAALGAETRDRRLDRELETREQLADIIESTNQQKLQQREQELQAHAIRMNNEMAMRELTTRMTRMRSNLVERAVNREQGLDLQREGLQQQADLTREKIQAGSMESELDRQARKELTEETEGGKDKRLDKQIQAADTRQDKAIEAQVESDKNKMATDLQLAEMGNEAAMNRLQATFREERAKNSKGFMQDVLMRGYQHRLDLAVYDRKLETESQTLSPNDREDLKSIIQEATNADTTEDVRNIFTTAQAVRFRNNAEGKEAIRTAATLSLLMKLENKASTGPLIGGNRLTGREFNDLMEAYEQVADPKILQGLKDDFLNYTGSMDKEGNRIGSSIEDGMVVPEWLANSIIRRLRAEVFPE